MNILRRRGVELWTCPLRRGNNSGSEQQRRGNNSGADELVGSCLSSTATDTFTRAVEVDTKVSGSRGSQGELQCGASGGALQGDVGPGQAVCVMGSNRTV